ncbi:hydroxyacylglutathione hydrolase [Leptospira perolatii]|uniref:hydroxyacylglutathione hydrolase n=1 Tax=Leptospira perolatii TaxID=2023191 RepID=A0A2M9ZJJ2_9LEPT|nr:hydroxyacylglutathione hydrolase family protein [Leptospira perolatii]PJZ68571.1 hydroxyacylglutathione hydrolase [Leptospira perolatii]PJZ72226.1 hydroxyacylglutathione hydrolase [Leptospira perolatii]
MQEIVRIYTNSPLRNFTYLVHESSTSQTLCIDPYDSEQVIRVLKQKGWSLQIIVNTHEHGDHTRGNEGLYKEFSPEVLTHKNAHRVVPFATRSVSNSERILESSDQLNYLRILDTPGHTFAHICLLQIEYEIPVAVFSGDTIFNCGVGNCKNGGDPTSLFETVSQIFQPLSDQVLLYPGHDYLKNNLRFSFDLDPSNDSTRLALENAESLSQDREFITATFGEERTYNPFFLCFEPTAQLISSVRRKAQNPELPSDRKSLFLSLRELRDRW